MENGDDPLGGLADFRYTCSYSGEAAQGVVSVDVNAARRTDWLDSLKKPFPMELLPPHIPDCKCRSET